MTDTALAPRLLCFHKQKTSARTRFLCHGTSVVAPAALATMAAMAAQLGLGTAQLNVVEEFVHTVATPDGPAPVLLVEIATLDPPFAAAEKCGARFIAITEARSLPASELELLRQAYEILIG